jgi:predicted metal-dependent hydrolase
VPRLPLLNTLQLLLWPDAAATPAPPIAPALAPMTFAHPRSNRRARLHGHHVAYEFRRARRKSIGFSISTEGLVVSAPRWVPLAEVESALQEKSRWILDKLREQDERARRLAAQRIEWRDGTSLPFLGQTLVVVLDAAAPGCVLHDVLDDGPTLHVGLPQTAAPEQIRDAVQAWLQRQAKRVFKERCDHFAPRLGVRVTKLSLSSATTRWGSAGADGAIRLHWRLIHFALPTIDYVVAHELAHLRVMDHSPRFWDVVRSVIPDVERVRETLRDEALPPLD